MATMNTWTKASEVPAHIHDAHRDSKRPIFHPLGPKGWSSDPCGPILFKGRYHLFYQHQHASCQWYWGLCWDHVVSTDLVHWKNLPPAVVPTQPAGLDADGCFSGTVEFDPELGVPVILYTGVYLKSNADAVAAHGLPPPEHDPGTCFVEKQLAAVPADPDDPDLTYWVKLPSPVMSLPPAGLNISCWRDPFCLKRPAAAGGEGDEWEVLLASGIRGVGGAVLRFRSKHFTHGWQFDGILADGDNRALGIRGQDWECPILARLPCVSREAVTAAIAVSTAAAPAAMAAKLPQHLSLLPGTATVCTAACSSSSSSSSSSKNDGMSQLEPPYTPLLKGRAPANSACLSSISGFGGSSLSLATAADDAASNDGGGSSSSPAGMPAAAAVLASTGAASGSAGTIAASTAAAAAAAIAAAGSVTAAAAAAVAVLPAAADEVGLLALPVTEPALAAVTSAAEAAPNHSADILSHPAVSVEAWLEHLTLQQLQEVVTAAAAAAAVSDNTVDAADVAVIIVDADDITSTDSHPKQQQQLLIPAASLASRLGSTTGGSNGGGSSDKRWWFAMSPDACNNPVTWWLGDYDGARFDVSAADGPHRLDLGTTLYAATLWEDPQGRQLLYGWMQEHRRVPTPPALCEEFSYAGCISTPRVLQLVGGQLWQTPLPEINSLRTSVCWRAHNLQLLPASQLVPLQVVSGTHLDINLTLLPPPAAAATAAASTPAGPEDLDAALAAAEGPRAGLVFKSWKPGGKGAAVLSFDWGSGVLMFDFDEPFPDAYNPHPEDTPERRRVGGRLQHFTTGDPLALRILLDGSAVEVFTSTGETLTTRMYRGHPPTCSCAGCSHPVAAATVTTAISSSSGEVEDETGIGLFASGAAVTVSELCVWEMGSCWVPPSTPPPQPPATLQQQQQLAAARQASSASAPAATAAVADAGVGSGSSSSSSGLPLVVRSKSEAAAEATVHEAAVHGLPATVSITAATATAEAAAVQAAAPFAEGASGEGEAVSAQAGDVHHHSAGDQAVVKEAFLEELHIQAK